jgi:NAD(P)-dependent dehydrogenase (short-subunit alcohol dehydrogenase family)
MDMGLAGRTALVTGSSRGSAWDAIEAAAAAAWVPNDIGRFGRPDEIAAAVVFLSGMHAGYISGANLRVDGGTIRSVAWQERSAVNERNGVQ